GPEAGADDGDRGCGGREGGPSPPQLGHHEYPRQGQEHDHGPEHRVGAEEIVRRAGAQPAVDLTRSVTAAMLAITSGSTSTSRHSTRTRLTWRRSPSSAMEASFSHGCPSPTPTALQSEAHG